VYPMGGFTENVIGLLPGIEDAVTTHLNRYYFDNLPEFHPLDMENVNRMNQALYERLGDLGNDMDYEFLVTVLISYGEPEEETFNKWFVFYGQYFDENGEAIDSLPKVIFALTQSEEGMLNQFNDPNNPNGWVVDGLARLTSSRIIGRNTELNYDGLLFGVQDNNGRKLYPHFRGIELYLEPGLEPAEAFI